MEVINEEEVKYNISNYLNTNEAIEYHKKLQNLLKFIEEITGCDVLVFGGYLRTVIQNFYLKEFKEPNDIDIWLEVKNRCSYSLNSYVKLLDAKFNFKYLHIPFDSATNKNNLEKCKEKYNISKINLASFPRSSFGNNNGPINYGLFRIEIDNIYFDIVTDLNVEPLTSFKRICDYTVNNLYFDSNGEINTRCESKYTINDILHHIKEKITYEIYDYEFLKKYYDEDGDNTYSYYKMFFL